jgi:hypothetical protein
MSSNVAKEKAKLQNKTVMELRKIASKSNVKQVTASGDRKNKQQLITSIQRAKHGYHGGSKGAGSH